MDAEARDVLEPGEEFDQFLDVAELGDDVAAPHVGEHAVVPDLPARRAPFHDRDHRALHPGDVLEAVDAVRDLEGHVETERSRVVVHRRSEGGRRGVRGGAARHAQASSTRFADSQRRVSSRLIPVRAA